jgi:hypothetical protein
MRTLPALARVRVLAIQIPFGDRWQRQLRSSARFYPSRHPYDRDSCLAVSSSHQQYFS